MPLPMSQSGTKLADFAGRVTPSQLRGQRFQTHQPVLEVPSYKTPLMHSHVSGLHTSKSGPTGHYRVKRFGHEVLSDEHGNSREAKLTQTSINSI